MFKKWFNFKQISLKQKKLKNNFVEKSKIQRCIFTKKNLNEFK